jgi:hypothetical protein
MTLVAIAIIIIAIVIINVGMVSWELGYMKGELKGQREQIAACSIARHKL